MELERYSSLRRLWTYLDAAERAGRQVTTPRGAPEGQCRRRISGFELPAAGPLLDLDRVTASLDDGFEVHPALTALLGGDAAPLRALMDEAYLLSVVFVLAFTRDRDLILKPELQYVPRGGGAPALSRDVTLVPRRFTRDELRYLLERACHLA